MPKNQVYNGALKKIKENRKTHELFSMRPEISLGTSPLPSLKKRHRRSKIYT